ncbi:MAG: FHA domain-containing protein [Wenzhouxiangella sp.]
MSANRRSIVIDGKVTSLMLEPSFWRYLDLLAETNGVSWAEFTRIALEGIGPTDNRAAAIKEHLLDHALGGSGLRPGGCFAPVISQWRIETGSKGRIETRFSSNLVAGRSRGCSLLLADEECSRFHAALIRVDGCWWAIDLNSKNGSRVDGRKITRCRLNVEEWLELGQSRLCLLKNKGDGRAK